LALYLHSPKGSGSGRVSKQTETNSGFNKQLIYYNNFLNYPSRYNRLEVLEIRKRYVLKGIANLREERSEREESAALLCCRVTPEGEVVQDQVLCW